MATKNLARTVIEGGRGNRNKWERRNSHAENRAAVRNYMQEVTLDPDNFEEYDVEPTEHVGKDFRDKLGPIYRWLNRQVGRPWDEVRADVAQEFDTRTTAGRHIVHDHMLSQVQTGENHHRWYTPLEDPTTSHSDHDYYVDDQGILRKKRYLGRRRYHGYETLPTLDTNRLINWLGNRIVGRVGDKFFWFVPAGKAKKHRSAYGERKYRLEWGSLKGSYSYYGNQGFRWEYRTTECVYKKNSLGQVIYQDGVPTVLERKEVWRTTSIPSLRQDRKLNDEELAYWNTLPAYYQTKVLEQSPNYPVPPKKDLYSGYYY